MYDPSIIFQRTHSGREEIRQKSHGLTQSERLVLIMVDGVARYQDVRSKLPVLTDERFERAIGNLQKKELIVEVFLPMEGQAADELEKTVVDRFLQQDPLDPVTILVRDPDEEFGIPGYAAEPAPARVPVPVSPTPMSAPAAAPETGFAMDEVHIRLADALAEELKAIQIERAARIERTERMEHSRSEKPEPMLAPPMPVPSEEPKPAFPKIHWGYWLIATGLAFIAGYFIARLTV